MVNGWGQLFKGGAYFKYLGERGAIINFEGGKGWLLFKVIQWGMFKPELLTAQ